MKDALKGQLNIDTGKTVLSRRFSTQMDGKYGEVALSHWLRELADEVDEDGLHKTMATPRKARKTK